MTTDAAIIEDFHAHIYYDETTRDVAAAIRQNIEDKFEVRMGRWRDSPVGPHPQAMYQVAFAPAVLNQLVPWLMLNHGPLDILIHPNTGDDVPDHTAHALWLGNKLDLNIDFLRNLNKP